MSITSTLSSIATLLLTANPTPQSALTRVITTDTEYTPEADFPMAVVRLPYESQMLFRSETMGNPGLLRHVYSLEIVVFVGALETPLTELSARLNPWPLAIAKVLAANQTLSGGVTFIGAGDSDLLIDCTIGAFQWIDGTPYYGLRFTLPITEKVSTTIG